MHSAEYWINHLHLNAHPEGGFYKETYRSKDFIPGTIGPGNAEGTRNISTAIYFLLRSGDRSAFHKIKSDELWHFHAGSSLVIYALNDIAGLTAHRLGLDLEKGDQPQVVIPADTWFGAMLEEENSFSLASCTVAPGFDFRDFEMAEKQKLSQEFPLYKNIIHLLT